ncbi:MAG: hypothetical protein IKZ81_00015, partial [Clostridia bacterium]|nr:hypothetical protein [Clostridia bacterium]
WLTVSPKVPDGKVFKGFTVPTTMTVDNSVVNLDLKVKADAVQARNIVNPDDYASVALAAKAAFTVLGA